MKQVAKTKAADWMPILILCFVIFLVMLVLTSLTPFGHDDFSYSFSFYDDTRIHSISQIIPSMLVHRKLLNGRLIPHSVVQFFLMLPKSVFNVFNAINSALLCYLLSRFLHSDGKNKASCLACGAMALWVFSPAFGENCLWLDGAINYAWGYSLFLLYLWPFVSEYLELTTVPDYTPVQFFLYIVLAFVVGSYSENASLVILFISGCLTILLWRRDRHLPWRNLVYVVAELGGWVFLMSAPSTANRGAEFNMSAIGNTLAQIITETKSYLLSLLLIVVMLMIIVSHFGGRRHVVVLSALFLLGSLASLLSFAFASYFIPRHFCCTVFLLVFALVLLLDETLFLRKILLGKVLAGLLIVLFAFQFSLGFLDIVVCYHKAQVREETILAAIDRGEHTVVVENCVPMTRYALRFHFSESDAKEWPNNVVESYYGIDEILGREPD